VIEAEGGLPASLPPAQGAGVQRDTIEAARTVGTARHAALLIYVVAFVTGAIVMSFEMLGSR